jgi:simple sugar transport system permease protein
MSSLLNFSGLSNFVRDFAWGLLLLLFLAVGHYDVVGFLTPSKGLLKPSSPVPQAPKPNN